jgi:hypothetical protein
MELSQHLRSQVQLGNEEKSSAARDSGGYLLN